MLALTANADLREVSSLLFGEVLVNNARQMLGKVFICPDHVSGGDLGLGDGRDELGGLLEALVGDSVWAETLPAAEVPVKATSSGLRGDAESRRTSGRVSELLGLDLLVLGLQVDVLDLLSCDQLLNDPLQGLA